MTYSDRDILTLSRTIYGEARNQPFGGKVAVAWVVLNRVQTDIGNDNKPDWWGEGVEAVCLKRAQFSCWNADDPNLPRLLAVSGSDIAMRDCLAAASAVLSEFEPDPTGGANHYLTQKARDTAPANHWSRTAEPLRTIGAHLFFKL